MYKTPVTLLHPRTTLLFKLSIMTSALASLGFMTGCSTTPTKTTTTTQTVKNQYTLLDASSLSSLEDLLSASDMRAVEGDRLLVLKYGDIWKRITVGFKMDLERRDSRINAQRSWFISRQPYLDRLSARASRYLYHTVKEAERRGLPTELALLPIIESSYDPAATSTAAAAGLWQFIPSTGKIYGLQQTSLYDGRRDVVESTRAAYEFLGSLYNQFGSWELALAAYNAGPGRIQQAINRNKAAGLPTDYWSLRLPEETMNYVPRFLAVAQIIKNPAAYNVRLPPIANRPHFREVRVQPNTDLNQIASTIGISRAELYALNPGYRGDRVDPASPMRILIPADVSGLVDKKLIALKPISGSTWTANSQAPENLSAVISKPVPYTPPAQPLTTVKQTPPALNSSSGNTTVLTTPSTTTQVTVKPANTALSSVSTTVKSTTSPATTVKAAPTTTPTITASTASSTAKRVSTPVGASALAQFAASADVPSAPRIPVAVKPVSEVKPVRVEPPITAAEREKLVATIAPEVKKAPQEAEKVVNELLQPTATEAQKQEVVEELKALAPAGTEVVDPYDGKINITAIQTSQSIAAQKGEEVKKGFSYPNELVAATANSEEAERNKGKNVLKTEDAVVVIPPKGKRTTYTIQPGDTLAIIAMKNGVSWRDIANWNQIDPNAYLYPGASLYLYDAKPQAEVATKPTNYVVQANDSLTGVADKFNLTVRDLAAWNGLTLQSGLRVGQKLTLVAPETSVQVSANSSPRIETKASSSQVETVSYQVKRGEYLKLIADRYGLSNQELAQLTPGLTSSSSLMVGQRINVPASAAQSSTATTPETAVTSAKAQNTKTAATIDSKNTETEVYRVQRGDTLYSIAQSHELTVAELASLNGFSAQTRLQAGQSIQVPAQVKIPEFYVVEAGDTLTGVANKFSLNMAQLAQLNGMTTQTGLRVGQRLRLTGAVASSGSSASQNTQPEAAKTKNEKSTSAATTVRETESYRVRAGESLNAIAPRYGLSVKELADLNGLNARAGLQVGQTIQVPKLVVEYKVRRGDTLIGLAARHGIEVSALADMNDLNPKAQLRIGDVIKVPN